MKFDPEESDGGDNKRWELKCSACDDTIYTIAGITYTSIDDLINKAKQNNNNANTCTCNALRIGVEEISKSELDACFSAPINCTATAQWVNSIGKSNFTYVSNCSNCNSPINIGTTLDHTGPIDADKQQYFHTKEEILEKLTNINSCTNCEYKFNGLEMNLRSKIYIIYRFQEVIGNKPARYGLCSACNEQLENVDIDSTNTKLYNYIYNKYPDKIHPVCKATLFND